MGMADWRIIRALRAFRNELGSRPEANSAPANDSQLAEQAERVRYLEFQVSRLSSIVRHLAAPVINDLPVAKETRDSFNFQWDRLPRGMTIDNPEVRREAADNVCRQTRLPREWFAGKSVIDVGCGGGRYSWALCQLGARVLSVDQSEHGLRSTAEACREFPHHRTRQINLLSDLGIEEQFDLVWSFGVLHHTGDTYGAFTRIAPLVKPGGYISLMIYGEPATLEEYRAVNEYESWRRRTANMTFDQRIDAIKAGMDRGEFAVRGDQYIHGYFDAISTKINDLYRYEEIEGWLIRAGFEDVQRTDPHRNMRLVARRKV